MRSSYILKINEEAFTQIREWMLSIIAGHYIGLIDQQIPKDFDPEEVLKIVKSLPQGRYWRHVMREQVFGVRWNSEFAYFERAQGFYRLDLWQLTKEKDLLYWLRDMKKKQDEKLRGPQSQDEIEFRASILPYLKSHTPRIYRTKASKSFELDWSSFPYPVRTPIDRIKVELFFSEKAHAKRGGLWNPSKKILQVDLPLRRGDYAKNALFRGLNSPGWAGFEACKRRAEEVLRHELMHVSQTVMSSDSIWAGLPSSKPPKKQSIHALRDKEFYPRIHNELQSLGLFRLFFSRHEIHRRVREHEFFIRLRVKQPRKWKKAVREFVRLALRMYAEGESS